MLGFARLRSAGFDLLQRLVPASRPGSRRKSSRKRVRRPLWTRLLLEPLEDRTLLSVSIAGTIFNDLHNDHTFDPGDPGVAAATAFIDVNHNGVLDQNADFNIAGPTTLAAPPPALAAEGVTAVSNPLVVSGITGALTGFKVHLNVQMTQADTIDVALVSPQGLIAGVGPDLVVLSSNGTSPTSFNGTLDDDALNGQNSALSGAVTGTFRPTTDTGDLGSGERLNSLARASGTDNFNDIYNSNPNGGWQLLFISFNNSNVNGLTVNSWSIEFTASEQTAVADGAGNYSFTGLPAVPGSGNYTLNGLPAVPAGGGTFTSPGLSVAAANAPTGNADTVVVPASGQASGVNLGIQPNPDLIGTAFSVAGTNVNWGSTVTVNYTVTNQGPADAPASSAEIRLSSDGIIDGSDELLTTVSLPVIPAGTSYSSSVPVQLPGSPPAGFTALDLSFLGLRINPAGAGAIAETNTSNDANRGQGLDLAPVVALTNQDVTNATGAQQQPSLAVDPNDAKHLVMAYMDYSQSTSGYAAIGVVSSHDGGLTWSAEQILKTPTVFNGLTGKALATGYPVVQFDSAGRAYVSYMAAMFFGNLPPVIFPDGGSRATVTVNGSSTPQSVLTRSFGMQSTNGIFVVGSPNGDDWSATPVAVETPWTYSGNGTPLTAADVPFDAVPDLAVNPTNGTLYVTFSRFYPAGQFPGATGTGGSDVWLYFSTDHGATWNPVLKPGTTNMPAIRPTASATFEAGTGAQFLSKVTVAPNSDVYVSLFFSSGPRSLVYRGPNGTGFALSGLTTATQFDPFMATTGSSTIPNYTVDSGVPFRNLPSRDIVADPTRPGTVYAADAIQVQNGTGTATVDPADINFSRSEDKAATWQNNFTVGGSAGNIGSLTVDPTLTVSDQTVYRTPLNDDDGSRYLRSVNPLTNEVISIQADPQMAVDPATGDIVVVWLDTRDDPNNLGINVYGAVSTDGGLTFGPNFRISDTTFYPANGAFTDGTGASDIFLGDSLGLAVLNGIAYVAWTDTRAGNQDIQFSRFALTALPAPPTDRFEPNDMPATTSDLGQISLQRIFPNLMATPGNLDFYRVTPSSTGTLNAAVTGGANLTLQVYDATGTTLLASGGPVFDASGQTVIGQQVLLAVQAGTPVLLRVAGNPVGGAAIPYSLSAQALTANLGTSVFGSQQHTLANGQNVFSVTAAATGSVNVQIQAQNTTGPLALTVLSGDGVTVLGTAQTTGTSGTAQLSVPVQQGQEILIQVSGLNEQQSVTLPKGTKALKFTFNSVAGTTLNFSTLTAAQVQANLNTIPALAGNVSVAGPSGGPFLVTFINQLAGQHQPLLSLVTSPAGGTMAEVTAGGGGGNYQLSFTNFDRSQTPGATSVFFPTAGDQVSLAVGQLNPGTDGLADVATASTALTNPVNVLLNDGTGLLGAPQTFDGGAGGQVRSVVLADFTGDGINDIAITNFNAADVTVLPGRGDGTFGSDHRSDALPFPGSLAVGHFFGTTADLVVFPFATSGGATPQIAVLQGHGDGTFFPPALLPTNLPAGQTFGLVADFNGDGHDDIAVFSPGSLTFQVFLNNGDGTFAAPITNFLPDKVASAVAADLNGDHKADLVVGSTTNGFIYTLLSNGQGGFTLGPSALANTDPKKLSSIIAGLAVADAGGPSGLGTPDGRLDLIVVVIPTVGGGPGQVNYLGGLLGAPGTFPGFAPAVQLATGAFHGPVAVADLDGDNRPDVIVLDTGGVRVLYNPAPRVSPNTTFATARDLGTVVHLVTPTEVISPSFPDAWYHVSAPTEAVQGAGQEILDISAQFQNVQPGTPGLSMEVLGPNGQPLPAAWVLEHFQAGVGIGERWRVIVPQGELLTIHVFGLPGSPNGTGTYVLDIDTLPQVVAVAANSALPGRNGNPGGPVTTLVVTLQGDRLDPKTAEDPNNYVVTWAGPDGKFGTADDQVIQPAGVNGGQPIVYDPGNNTVASSGRTFPTSVSQTVTLFFANPLPAGSYTVKLKPGVQAAPFSTAEEGVLVNGPNITDHPVVSVVGGALVEGSTAPATVAPFGPPEDLGAIASGTTFLTEFHGNEGALLNSLQNSMGDAPAITPAMDNQILSTFAPGANGVSFLVIWLDPVSIRLQDPNGARTVYDLPTNAVSNNISRAFVEVGGNIEVLVLAGVSGTFTLNIDSVQTTARGGAVVLGGGQTETVALTDLIRAGARTFQFNVPEQVAAIGSPASLPTSGGSTSAEGGTSSAGGSTVAGGAQQTGVVGPTPGASLAATGPVGSAGTLAAAESAGAAAAAASAAGATGGTGTTSVGGGGTSTLASTFQNLAIINGIVVTLFGVLVPQEQVGEGAGAQSATSTGPRNQGPGSAVQNPPGVGGGIDPQLAAELATLEAAALQAEALGDPGGAVLRMIREQIERLLQSGTLPANRPANQAPNNLRGEVPAAPPPAELARLPEADEARLAEGAVTPAFVPVIEWAAALPAAAPAGGAEPQTPAAVVESATPASLSADGAALPGPSDRLYPLLSAAIFAAGFCQNWWGDADEKRRPERARARPRAE